MAIVIHDVLIIGAGPAGLAIAARLREPTPSSIFTDAEHDRYQWIRKHSRRMNLRPRAQASQRSKCFSPLSTSSDKNNSATISSCQNGEIDILVLDSSGQNWLSSWKQSFAALEISHLRSPMFFHPCPHDRDGLLAYAYETGRYDECIEIANCVQKSMSKHRRKKKVAKGQVVGSANAKAVLEIDERDRKDYFTPSAEVFHDYCDGVVHQYGLENLVEQSQVASIDFGCFDEFDFPYSDSPEDKLFKVVTSCGSIKVAKIVILAVGAGGGPIMPRHLSAAEREGACHSTHLLKQPFLATNVRQKILARKPTTVIVVGGGLTAAQLANKCIRDGVRRVFLIMRSALKLKPFDVDLEWMGKYKNVQKAIFWSADSDEGKTLAERLDILLQARNGGSISPYFFKKLQAHVTRGTLSIHTDTNISNQAWDVHSETWSIETEPAIADLPTQVDYIYYATGVRPDVEQLPFLSPLREKVPIKVIGGMPCLTDDLAWADDVPLFITGRLAGLRIGPDCGNLEGARVGAERISWAVNERLERQQKESTEIYQRMGSVNMYDSLETCGV